MCASLGVTETQRHNESEGRRRSLYSCYYGRGWHGG